MGEQRLGIQDQLADRCSKWEWSDRQIPTRCAAQIQRAAVGFRLVKLFSWRCSQLGGDGAGAGGTSVDAADLFHVLIPVLVPVMVLTT